MTFDRTRTQMRAAFVCAALLAVLAFRITPALADPPPVLLHVPFYSQFDPLWSEVLVGRHLDVPMRRGGSLLTCIAMLASAEGFIPRFPVPGEIDLLPSPDYIDAYLVFVNGYRGNQPKSVVIDYHAFRRGFLTNTGIPAGISFAPTGGGAILGNVDEALAFGHPSIIYLEPDEGQFHPLVVAGWDSSTDSYFVLDPAWRSASRGPRPMADLYGKRWRSVIVGGLTASFWTANDSPDPLDPAPLLLAAPRPELGQPRDPSASGLALGRVGDPAAALQPQGDPTRVALDPVISVATDASVEITAVDPEGRRVGFDPSTGATIVDVPRASYVPDPRFADPTGLLIPPAPGRVLTIPRAAAGRYRFEMVATADGPYALNVVAYNRGGDRVIQENQSGTAAAGDVLKLQVEYSDNGPSRFTVGDNFSPEADTGGARRTRVGMPVAFDGGASFDIDGAITSYHWDFGDGATATGLTPSHAYASAGIYAVTLTVTDDHQAVDADTVNVAVYAETATAGVTEAASVDSDGVLAFDDGSGGNGSFYPALSGDGRIVAFASSATSLGGPSGSLFVRDRDRGTTTVASPPSCQGTSFPAVSANGRFVAFECMIASQGAGMRTILVQDRRTGTNERVDVASTGEAGVCDGPGCGSFRPAISEDGRWVAFLSSDANLVPGDTNGALDAFLHDRATGSTERVSVAHDGAEVAAGADTGNPEYRRLDVSADGRFVAFASLANDLVPGTTFPAPRVYVRDRVQHLTELVSAATAGPVSNVTGGDYPSLSADGRFVAFSSPSPDLVPGDTNTAVDVFVRDRQAGTTTRVNLTGAGGEAVCGSLAGDRHICTRNPVISRDGRVVVFRSEADNLVLDDTNHREDVFVRDLEHGTTALVSRATDDTLGNGASGEAHFFNDATQIALSRDGRFVAFTSDATTLVAADDNGLEDVFVRDRQPNSPIADPSGPYVGWATSAGEPASVTFDASRSIDPLGQPLTAEWDFGDGSAPVTASSATPVAHAYAAAGTYEVRLVVSAGTRRSAPATTTAYIQTPRAAELRLHAPCGSPGETLRATATGHPLVPAVGGWNLGNGPVPATDEIAPGGTARVRATGPLPAPVEQIVPIDSTSATTLAFSTSFAIDVGAAWGPGVYTLSLPDDAGRTATFTVPCPALANEPPHAHVGGPYTGTVGVPVLFDGGTSVDPEGAPLTFTWYFDDGATATAPAPSHAFATPGVHYALLVVDDGALESPTSVGTDSFAIVTITGGAAETTLGSFTVYQTKAAAGAVALPMLGPVTLADAIGSAAYAVTKNVGLGVPAEVDAGGLLDPDTHLAAYAVKRVKGSPKFAKQADVPITTACGTTVVTLAKPAQLLIPAHASATGPVSPPTADDDTVDRFLCYAAKAQKRRLDGSPVAALAKGAQVDVADAFQTRRYDLKRLAFVCNPVAVSGTPTVLAGPRKGTTVPIAAARIDAPDARLACYRAALAKRFVPQIACGATDPKDKGAKIVPPQPKHRQLRGVAIADALETSAVDTKKERLLCLPAS